MVIDNMKEPICNSQFCYYRYTENNYFFYFDTNDFEHKVNDFCDELRAHNIIGANPTMETSDYLAPLKSIMKSIEPPYTVILEHYYVDKSFRDSYYRYFSSSHFNTSRFSRRLSFFRGNVTEEEFFNHKIRCDSIQTAQKESDGAQQQLVYYGSVVLNPLMTGAIGRTILDPRCLNLHESGKYPVYMRLSHFKTRILGRTLKVDAFPYRMQDGETIRCAEVTILNLLDYYSNHYPDYRSALPGEILDEEERHSNERVLPSKGMSYAIMSKLMSNFGFFPRLYGRQSIDEFVASHITPEIKLKRWMYYYIESGIPVAVELGSDRAKDSGHSVICIGHGAFDRKKIKDAYNIGHKKDQKRTILNSADFYDSFIIVDDNLPVYNIQNYRQLSKHKELELMTLAVPLNRRMCLDAPDAEATVLSILNDDNLGLDKWIEKGYLEEGEAVLMRLYLASSHSFKKYRISTLTDIDLKAFYAYTPMPRFIWVCELYKVKDYLNQVEDSTDVIKAFAEIVLDTTTVPTKENPSKCLILAHYPGKIAARLPEEAHMGFDEMGRVENDMPFPGFRNNLTKIF